MYAFTPSLIPGDHQNYLSGKSKQANFSGEPNMKHGSRKALFVTTFNNCRDHLESLVRLYSIWRMCRDNDALASIK